MIKVSKFSIILLAQILSITCLKRSMYDPPWKHCVHQLQPQKYWQEFASPGFPHGIKTQTQCSWIIVVPNPKQRIRLAFDTLNLTGFINNCFTQYVEFWEINTASSMGKFCGDKRPGDYVSYEIRTWLTLNEKWCTNVSRNTMWQIIFNCYRYHFKNGDLGLTSTLADRCCQVATGATFLHSLLCFLGNAVRVDLKADTADVGHIGFLMKYRMTREKGGYRHEYSFPKLPSGAAVENDSKEKSTKSPPKTKKLNTGGRINLTYMKRLREEAAKKKSGNTENTKVIPRRFVRPATLPKPRPFDKNKNKELIIVNENKSTVGGFELWILIVIAAGVIVFFVCLSVLTWFCFCRKKKSKPKIDSSSSRRRNQQDTKISNVEFIQDGRHHHLLPGFYPYANQFASTSNYHGKSFHHMSLSQPSCNDSKNNQSDLQNMQHYTSAKQTCNNFSDQIGLEIKNLGAPEARIMDMQHFDKAKLQDLQTLKGKKKPVPTLKRKFSTWEKEQIRRGNTKI